MIQWEYNITLHKAPQISNEVRQGIIECDQMGHCLIHEAFRGGIQWLEELFYEKGKEGWELIQLGYHNQELLCIWKRRKEDIQKA